MRSEEDIEAVLKQMESRFADAGEGPRKMLGMLITVALGYRDELVGKNEPALTVGETRSALDAFMLILKTKQFPNISEPRIKALVIKWLEEIRKTVHN